VSRIVLPALALLAAVVLAGGCRPAKQEGQADPAPGGGPGDKGTPSKVKQIMTRLGKGPQALTGVIGKELQANDLPWDDLQTQAKEYAELTAELGKQAPSRGRAESWTEQTAGFAEAAAALERAVRTRNLDEAKAAHARLSSSCMPCHREHRGPGPGKGG
jgi:cytochrome c556